MSKYVRKVHSFIINQFQLKGDPDITLLIEFMPKKLKEYMTSLEELNLLHIKNEAKFSSMLFDSLEDSDDSSNTQKREIEKLLDALNIPQAKYRNQINSILFIPNPLRKATLLIRMLLDAGCNFYGEIAKIAKEIDQNNLEKITQEELDDYIIYPKSSSIITYNGISEANKKGSIKITDSTRKECSLYSYSRNKSPQSNELIILKEKLTQGLKALYKEYWALLYDFKSLRLSEIKKIYSNLAELRVYLFKMFEAKIIGIEETLESLHKKLTLKEKDLELKNNPFIKDLAIELFYHADNQNNELGYFSMTLSDIIQEVFAALKYRLSANLLVKIAYFCLWNAEEFTPISYLRKLLSTIENLPASNKRVNTQGTINMLLQDSEFKNLYEKNKENFEKLGTTCTIGELLNCLPSPHNTLRDIYLSAFAYSTVTIMTKGQAGIIGFRDVIKGVDDIGIIYEGAIRGPKRKEDSIILENLAELFKEVEAKINVDKLSEALKEAFKGIKEAFKAQGLLKDL